jgi:hypothetical protein
MKATLNQDQLNQIQAILQLFPISHLQQVQKIVEILNASVVNEPVEELHPK